MESPILSSDATGRALPLVMAWKKKGEEAALGSRTTKYEAPSDEELMARAQAADQDALGILFERYSRLVLSIAIRILDDFG
jgi:hypothetical protein